MSQSRELMNTAAQRVIAALGRIRNADRSAATPCEDFTVGELAEHALGTMTMLAATGRRTEPPAAPEVTAQWPQDLAAAIEEAASVWSDSAAWEGEVSMGGATMPAAMIGDMVLAEILLHGWDLSRATAVELEVDDAVATELRRGVEETAELGRQVGAYGAAVEVPDDATDLDHALGAAGRDPAWQA